MHTCIALPVDARLNLDGSTELFPPRCEIQGVQMMAIRTRIFAVRIFAGGHEVDSIVSKGDDRRAHNAYFLRNVTIDRLVGSGIDSQPCVVVAWIDISRTDVWVW